MWDKIGEYLNVFLDLMFNSLILKNDLLFELIVMGEVKIDLFIVFKIFEGSYNE